MHFVNTRRIRILVVAAKYIRTLCQEILLIKRRLLVGIVGQVSVREQISFTNSPTRPAVDCLADGVPRRVLRDHHSGPAMFEVLALKQSRGNPKLLAND